MTGIDGRTVKVVFNVKMEPCGDSEAQSAENLLNDEGEKAITEFVRFFNEEVLADYDWTIESQFVDDGGAYCPEKARAAGRQIAEEIKPFAVIGDSGSIDQGPIVADMVTRAGIRHIGISWNVDAEILDRAPYAWQINETAQQAYEDLAGYIGRRVKDTPGHDPASREEMPDRHYGLVTLDLPEYHTLAEILANDLEAEGIELEQTYFVSANPDEAGQTAATTVSKMVSDGINTLVFDFFNTAGLMSGVNLTKTMAQQNYRPDILTGTYGVAAIIDPLHDPTVWANASGISSYTPLALRAAIIANPDGSYGYDPEYELISENYGQTAWVNVWKHLGYADEMTTASPSVYNRYVGLAVLAVGLMNAGDTVTDRSFAEGVWSTAAGAPHRCDLNRFLGADYEYVPNYSWSEGQTGPLGEFTTIHWREEATAIGTSGYWDSFDNYEYVADAADLASAPAHDTATTPVDVPHQAPTGINPWTACP